MPSAVNGILLTAGQCTLIIGLGSVLRRTGAFTEGDVVGINKFLFSVSLPALFFLTLATLDWSDLNFSLLAALCLAKAAVFAFVGAVTYHGTRDASRLGLAGLYSILATQSNDIAIGVPLLGAIFGSKQSSYLYLLAPFQLLVLNPIGISLLKLDRERRRRARAQARRARFSRHVEILRSMATDPIIMSCIIGIIVNLAFGHNALPEVFANTARVLSYTYSGAALFALGLSLRFAVGDGIEVGRVALIVAAKIVLLPLLMASIAQLLSDNFKAFRIAFIYGMLPTAPNVFVFAAKYGLREGFAATTSFVCLLTAVPVLLLAGVAFDVGDSETRNSNRVSLDAGTAASSTSMACAVATLALAYLARQSRPLQSHWLLIVIMTGVALADACVRLTCVHGNASPSARIALEVASLFFSAVIRCYAIVLAHWIYKRASRSAADIPLGIKVHFIVCGACAFYALLCAAVPTLQPTPTTPDINDSNYVRNKFACSTELSVDLLALECVGNLLLGLVTMYWLVVFHRRLSRRLQNRESVTIGDQGAPIIPRPKFSSSAGDLKFLEELDDAESGAASRGSRTGKSADDAEARSEASRHTILLSFLVAGSIFSALSRASTIQRLGSHSEAYLNVITALDLVFNYSSGIIIFVLYCTHPAHRVVLLELRDRIKAALRGRTFRGGTSPQSTAQRHLTAPFLGGRRDRGARAPETVFEDAPDRKRGAPTSLPVESRSGDYRVSLNTGASNRLGIVASKPTSGRSTRASTAKGTPQQVPMPRPQERIPSGTLIQSIAPPSSLPVVSAASLSSDNGGLGARGEYSADAPLLPQPESDGVLAQGEI